MVRTACSIGALVVAVSCLEAGAASNQVETLLYDTHNKVTNLNDNLDGAIKRLNETTTQLVSRVDETELQTRQLKSMMEENQVKLDVLEKQLGELTTTLYRQLGLTSGGRYNPAQPPSDSISIVPPTGGETPVPGAGTPALQTSSEPAPETPTSAPASGAAHAMYQQAQKTWLNNDFDGALQLFSDFLSRYPDTELAANAQYWQGRCYLKLDRNEEAVSAFKNVRSNYPSDPKVPQAMQSQAVALSRLGRTDEARQLLEEVVQKFPTTSAARQAEQDLASIRGN